MIFLLKLIALLGILALVGRVARATLVVARGAVEGYLLRTVAQTQAQRGDLTGIIEARERQVTQRRARLRAWGMLLGWLVLLCVPPFTPFARMIYAVCALLWLVPRNRHTGVRA